MTLTSMATGAFRDLADEVVGLLPSRPRGLQRDVVPGRDRQLLLAVDVVHTVARARRWMLTDGPRRAVLELRRCESGHQTGELAQAAAPIGTLQLGLVVAARTWSCVPVRTGFSCSSTNFSACPLECMTPSSSVCTAPAASSAMQAQTDSAVNTALII